MTRFADLKAYKLVGGEASVRISVSGPSMSKYTHILKKVWLEDLGLGFLLGFF